MQYNIYIYIIYTHMILICIIWNYTGVKIILSLASYSVG